jgi:hypothetical protein
MPGERLVYFHCQVYDIPDPTSSSCLLTFHGRLSTGMSGDGKFDHKVANTYIAIPRHRMRLTCNSYYDKVPKAINFRALAQKIQLKILDSRILSWKF